MKASVFLWIAAAVVIVESVAHTFLFVRYAPSHGPAEAAVVETMKTTAVRFGWAPHSYWELYFGYGLFVTVGVLVEAGLLISLALWPQGAGLRPMLAILFLGEIAYGALIFRYFSFPIPLATHGLVAFCLISAFFAAR